MATMNISLPDQMKQWVEDQIGTGRYANASDYMRDLVRKDQEHRLVSELQEVVDKAIASGISTRNRDELLAYARATADRTLKDRDGKKHVA